jgi:hypothetical protein
VLLVRLKTELLHYLKQKYESLKEGGFETAVYNSFTL